MGALAGGGPLGGRPRPEQVETIGGTAIGFDHDRPVSQIREGFSSIDPPYLAIVAM
jgi:hypothetical protein